VAQLWDKLVEQVPLVVRTTQWPGLLTCSAHVLLMFNSRVLTAIQAELQAQTQAPTLAAVVAELQACLVLEVTAGAQVLATQVLVMAQAAAVEAVPETAGAELTACALFTQLTLYKVHEC
jgi:hypothetical protein